MIVLPIFEPSITPNPCTNVNKPEFTKLTSITVVALLLCITIVTNAPTPTARSRFDVNFSSTERILFPAAIFIPSLIISIPYRNIPIPPKRLVTIKNHDMSFPVEPATEEANTRVGIVIIINITIGRKFFFLIVSYIFYHLLVFY